MSEGELIIDEFQLVHCIITGTHTSVWEASEQGTGTHYAVKLLLPDSFKDPEQKASLKHEAKVGLSLDHPNFVKFHKLVVNKQYGYIVMDYFRSMNLKAAVQGDLTMIHARIRKLVDTICQALGYMHDQGWLHRDVKPDNILFNKASEVRLIDFSLASRVPSGISKLLSGKVKFVQGTRTYIAPETIQKKQPSIQTDIYSLGVTLFELLTGKPPFKGSSPDDLLRKHISTKPPTPSDFNRNVTPQMDQLILRMLAKKPQNRPKDMREVNAELRNVKIFHEDVVEGEVSEEEQERARNQQLAEANRLDSRADAARQEIYKQNPELAPKPKPKPKPAAPAPAPAAQQPAVQHPVAHQPPGQYPPGGYPPQQQPGQYPPQQYPPPNYQPQYPPPQPGQYPPVAYPGYPPPGYAAPGAPQQYPPPQPPSQPYPQGQPYPGQPAAAQPGGPQPQHPPAGPPPGAPQPPATSSDQTQQKKKPNDDDLPFMEELPDII